MPKNRWFLWGLLALSLPLAGCGSDAQPTPASVQPLDPAGVHFGKTYAEWAAAWWKWLYELVPTEACGEPVGDSTGALCDLGQDDNSPVFFLTGTWGDVGATRPDCVATSGKALFFPLVTSSSDNGGRDEDQLETPEQHRARVESDLENMPTSELALSVDGAAISGLERLVVGPTAYQYTLPASERNMFSCVIGVDGVTGNFDGFTSGYFALLPPLEPGTHNLEYSGKFADAEVIRVSYKPLTVF